MPDITLRKPDIQDVSALRNIGIQTFCESFSDQNTEENMQQYLADKFSVEQLSVEMNDPNAQFYFAETEGRVIGYLKINTGSSQTEKLEGQCLEIERIYVLKEYHGKQVGQLLYNKAIQVAEELQADFVWLGVWEENHRAIHFYRKNGFLEFGKHIFKLGDDEQTDIMMKKPLR